MIKKLLSWVILLVAFVGCTDSAEPDPNMMGYQYYPLEVDDYRIYYVTDIRFQFDKGDTSRFQMREIVKSSYLDQTNTLNYRIERSIRQDDNSPWLADSIFTVTKSMTNVILMKDNTHRVKLAFPVKEGKSWLGDAFNFNGDLDPSTDVKDKETYTFANVNSPFTFDKNRLIYNNTALQFDSTATVVHGIPSETVIAFNDRKEVYAHGVGMIYRLFNRLNYSRCSSDNCEDFEKTILDGVERHEVLIEHGKRYQ